MLNYALTMRGAGIRFQGSWPLAAAILIGLLLWGAEESVASTPDAAMVQVGGEPG